MRHFRKTINKELGEILVDRAVINRSQLESILSFQKQKGLLFGEALVEMKLGTEEDVIQALIYQYGFPYLPLVSYDIAPEVVAIVSSEICRKYALVPIDKIGKCLTLAMANPLNVTALEEVEKATGCAVQTFVSTATEINNAINRYYVTR